MTVDWRTVAGIAAGILSIVGPIVYIVEILRGRTKPSRVTWWTWTVVGLMILMTYYAAGARRTLWIPVVYFLMPLMIAVLSEKYGRYGRGHKLSRLDMVCIAGSIIGAVIWWQTGSPVVSLAAFLVVDAFGAVPTVVKSWQRPKEESSLAWAASFAATAMNLNAVEFWTFAEAAYPVYMASATGIIVLILVFRSNRLS